MLGFSNAFTASSDSMSVSKSSPASLTSLSSFSSTDCNNKFKEHSLSSYLPIAEWVKNN